MTKATLLAATAAIAFIATPALAQDTVQPRANVHAKSYKAGHHSVHHARAMRSSDRFARRDELDNRRDRSGFWPVDTATGIAGGAINTAGAIASGAVGTAGAIATAPFRGLSGDSYYGRADRPYGEVAYGARYGAEGGYPYGNRYRYGDTYAFADEDFGTYSYNGIAIPGSSSFDARNGFTCRPGTVTKLANGERTICQ